MKEKRDEARANIEAAQAKQKERYDIKHSGAVYVVGQKVMKYNRRRDTRMGDKLAQRFTGPFTVHEILGKGVYRLMDGDKIMKQVVNASNLKPYIAPGSPESRKPAPRSPSTAGQTTPRSDSTPRKTTPRSTSTPRKSSSASAAASSSASASAAQTPTRSPSAARHRAWIKELNLDRADRDLVAAQDGLLNDKVADAVNALVRDKIGDNHHQSTLLAQIPKGFSKVSAE